MNIFEKEGTKLLIDAILRLKDEEQCAAFLDDLMTVKELVAKFSQASGEEFSDGQALLG